MREDYHQGWFPKDMGQMCVTYFQSCLPLENNAMHLRYLRNRWHEPLQAGVCLCLTSVATPRVEHRAKSKVTTCQMHTDPPVPSETGPRAGILSHKLPYQLRLRVRAGKDWLCLQQCELRPLTGHVPGAPWAPVQNKMKMPMGLYPFSPTANSCNLKTADMPEYVFPEPQKSITVRGLLNERGVI